MFPVINHNLIYFQRRAVEGAGSQGWDGREDNVPSGSGFHDCRSLLEKPRSVICHHLGDVSPGAKEKIHQRKHKSQNGGFTAAPALPEWQGERGHKERSLQEPHLTQTGRS